MSTESPARVASAYIGQSKLVLGCGFIVMYDPSLGWTHTAQHTKRYVCVVKQRIVRKRDSLPVWCENLTQDAVAANIFHHFTSNPKGVMTIFYYVK